jgi:hypothetical protein
LAIEASDAIITEDKIDSAELHEWAIEMAHEFCLNFFAH